MLLFLPGFPSSYDLLFVIAIVSRTVCLLLLDLLTSELKYIRVGIILMSSISNGVLILVWLEVCFVVLSIPSGLKRACVKYNSTYAHFTSRIDPSGRGIKGGCPGRKRLPCAQIWRLN